MSEEPTDTSSVEDEGTQANTQEIEYLSYDQVVEAQEDNAKEYHRITIRLELLSTFLGLAVLFLLVWFKFPNLLRDMSPFGSDYSFLSIVFVYILFYLVDFLVSFPLSYYREQIEHRFEFATRSTREWFMDKLKELGLGLLISVLLIEALFAALHYQPDWWWIYAFFGYFVVAGILSSLSPFLISIFTKIDSLEEGEIRSTVEGIANQMDLDYEDIYQWHISDQSTKANAAVTGFGRTIRIMLGDTLTENFRSDEIEVVMAHEIAHQKQKDVYRNILFSGIISLVVFYLVDLGFPEALATLDLNGKSDPAAVGYIFLAMSFIFLFMGKLNLWYSRRREKAADLVAIDQVKDIEVFESAFARLSKQNLSFPNPSTLEVWWRYSHPPIRDRIEYAKDYFAKMKSE